MDFRHPVPEIRSDVSKEDLKSVGRVINTLQHTATHCNTLQHTATAK